MNDKIDHGFKEDGKIIESKLERIITVLELHFPFIALAAVCSIPFLLAVISITLIIKF